MARPEWNKVDTYPQDFNDWTYSRWAWEFLRRNVKFQEDCERVLHGSLEQRRTMARSFGLAEYKYFKEPHLVGDRCIWLPEAICKYKPGGDKEISTMIRLKPGEVALVFDLNLIEQVGASTLDAQLYTARTVLEEYRIQFGIKERKSKVTKRNLFKLLRVYDGVVYSENKPAVVARELYPDDFKATNGRASDLAASATQRVADQLKRAKRMVGEDYILLPSRDYIQNRSKKR